jgi:hypothetical protein
VNPTTEKTMWLAYVRALLVFNIEETQRQYKENVDEHWKK